METQSKEKTPWDNSNSWHDGNINLNDVSELAASLYQNGLSLMNKTRVRLSLGFSEDTAAVWQQTSAVLRCCVCKRSQFPKSGDSSSLSVLTTHSHIYSLCHSCFEWSKHQRSQCLTFCLWNHQSHFPNFACLAARVRGYIWLPIPHLTCRHHSMTVLEGWSRWKFLSQQVPLSFSPK